MLIDIERPKIDSISFVMCLLLAQLKIGFFSSFFAAAVYRTNEANKAGLKQSIFLDVYAHAAPKNRQICLAKMSTTQNIQFLVSNFPIVCSICVQENEQ